MVTVEGYTLFVAIVSVVIAAAAVVATFLSSLMKKEVFITFNNFFKIIQLQG